MASNPYVDYTAGRPIRYTAYARYRMRQRFIHEVDVWWVLAHHDSDRPSRHVDTPHRRELVAEVGRRRLLVVVEPHAGEVVVINAYLVDPGFARAHSGRH